MTTCVGSAKARRQRLFAFELPRGEYAADSAAESDLPSQAVASPLVMSALKKYARPHRVTIGTSRCHGRHAGRGRRPARALPLRLNDPHCFTRTTNPLAGITAFSRWCEDQMVAPRLPTLAPP